MKMPYDVLCSKIARYLAVYPRELVRLAKVSRDLKQQKCLSAEELLTCFYQHLMNTSPSSQAKSFYLDLLASNQISAEQLLVSFLMIPGSVEQATFGSTGIHAHHQARLKLVRDYLPAASKILDLGGASPESPEGALLAMGYPHVPDQVDIIDFPPEKRFFHPPVVPQQGSLTSVQGTKINYTYGSFSDLSTFADHTYDLIWSGQSIEHIHTTEAELVFQQARRILKPGGWLCLDTPNRKLTRLLVHYGYVHPEHKIEYEPEALKNLLQKNGFSVVDERSVSPMPLSLESGRFSRLELIRSVNIGSEPNEGFSFFLAAQNKL